MKSNKLEKVFFIAAMVSYLPAWYYVRYVLFFNPLAELFPAPSYLIFACMFMALIEVWCRTMERCGSKESGLWAVLYLMQSAALCIYGYHLEDLGILQALLWHLTAVYYVLARCGGLSQKRTGGMLGLDLCYGMLVLPWKNFFLRVRSLFHGFEHFKQDGKHLTAVILTIAAALCCVIFAVNQLAQADHSFAQAADSFSQFFEQLFSSDFWIYFLISLPVGMWLFGLIGGCIKAEHSCFDSSRTASWLQSHRLIPVWSMAFILIVLDALYVLFFAISISGYLQAVQTQLAAPDASSYAVNGFYELCRILLFNGILLGVRFKFTDADHQQGNLLKISSVVLTICSIAFALLDFGKLMVYSNLYGVTPRRFLAFFSLLWLLGMAILMLIRNFRVLPLVRIGFLAMMIGFSFLCLMDCEEIIFQLNQKRETVSESAAVRSDFQSDVTVLRANSVQAGSIHTDE